MNVVDRGGRSRHQVIDVQRSGRDPDEAAAFYESVYNGRDFHFDPGETAFRFRYRATGDDRVTLRSSSVAGHWRGRLAPERQYVLAWSVEGGVVLDPGTSTPIVMAPGMPVVYPTRRPFAAVSPPGTQHLVHVDADYLEAVASVRDGPPHPLALPSVVPGGRLGRLQAAIRHAAPALLDVHTATVDRVALDLSVAEALLDAFRPLPDGHSSDPGASTVERAKAYLYDHFDHPVTAADIASAVGVSVRTLQESFQRQAGITPMAFLRAVRLGKARLALQLADQSEASVADLAHACGFRHMGRFSGAYHDEFGEYPGETLRQPARPGGLPTDRSDVPEVSPV